MLSNFISSSIGAIVAEFTTLPISTVKNIYQNDLHASSFKICKQIYRRDGIKGFYNGGTGAITSQILNSAVKYTMYQEIKRNFNTTNSFTFNVANSIFCNVIVSLASHPFDVVQITRQLGTFKFRQNYYCGYSKTFSKTIIGGALFLPIYDKFNHYFDNATVSAFCTATTATVLMHPIDLFKTRQIGGSNIYTKDIFRGLGLNLLRVVPHFTISMSVIAFCLKKIEI